MNAQIDVRPRAADDPGPDARPAPTPRIELPIEAARWTAARSRARGSSSCPAGRTCRTTATRMPSLRRDRGVRHRRVPRSGRWDAPSRTACSRRSSSRTSSARRQQAVELGDRALARAARAPSRARPRASSRASAAARSTRPATASSPRSTARRARSAAPARSRTACASSGIEVRAGLHTGECEVDRRQGRRDRRAHRRARRRAGGRGRGARVEHGQGSRRRLRTRVRGPRRAHSSRASRANGASTPSRRDGTNSAPGALSLAMDVTDETSRPR